MIIGKMQAKADNALLRWAFFSSAREGLRAVLDLPGIKGRTLLLPAYIGQSSREGSGVFDPVRAAGTKYEFYRMDETLSIDTADLVRRMQRHPGCAVLLIHYFGFKDANLDLVKGYARATGATVIEDFAHALFTFCLNPAVDFDHAVFSLHKMLPLPTGGMVLSREDAVRGTAAPVNLLAYNAFEIARQRVRNYRFLLGRLSSFPFGKIMPLRRHLEDNVPQTFPVLVESRALRDKLYFLLNEQGFGAVSLYHELIGEAGPEYAVEHALSDRILNLPVHQDADLPALERMCEAVNALLRDGE